MSTYKRNDRELNKIRSLEITPNFQPNNQSSCLVKLGNTHVCCSAILEDRVPGFLRNSGKGWLTAEYGMLPSSTSERMDREAAKGRQSGRTQEIQRLIGRSLRSVVDLKKLSDYQIKIDCDVIQADGGTRTASITGAWVALYQAINFLLKSGKLTENPLLDQVAAISCGICENQELVDLDYEEDSNAETDGNFVMTSNNGIVEIQTTAEEKPFKKEQFQRLLNLAETSTENIFKIQQEALGLN